MKHESMIKGEYTRIDEGYLYKEKRIISGRKGSIVRITGGEVHIEADVTGIDKVYISSDEDGIKISNTLLDFIDKGINRRFEGFQYHKGYIPYPFTIFNNVIKAPPGLIAVISMEAPTLEFKPSDDLRIFSREGDKVVSKRYYRVSLRKNLVDALRASLPDEESVICSFSGGFDSRLLAMVFQDRCLHYMHFVEKDEIPKEYQNGTWSLIDHNSMFDDEDRKKYFQSIDEPSCDSCGFAEYLIAREVSRNGHINGQLIMNGQAADALFANGRIYFRNSISAILGHPLRIGMVHKERTGRQHLASRLMNYLIDTRARFFRFYMPDYGFNLEDYEMLDKVYNAYAADIENDPTNFLAALMFLLYYPLHGVEKIKISARASNIRYFLPFMSTEVVSIAFGIPSRYKVGRRRGKRVLLETFPEISRDGSGSFKPDRLQMRFIENRLDNQGYQKYFFDNWKQSLG